MHFCILNWFSINMLDHDPASKGSQPGALEASVGSGGREETMCRWIWGVGFSGVWGVGSPTVVKANHQLHRNAPSGCRSSSP